MDHNNSFYPLKEKSSLLKEKEYQILYAVLYSRVISNHQFAIAMDGNMIFLPDQIYGRSPFEDPLSGGRLFCEVLKDFGFDFEVKEGDNKRKKDTLNFVVNEIKDHTNFSVKVPNKNGNIYTKAWSTIDTSSSGVNSGKHEILVNRENLTCLSERGIWFDGRVDPELKQKYDSVEDALLADTNVYGDPEKALCLHRLLFEHGLNRVEEQGYEISKEHYMDDYKAVVFDLRLPAWLENRLVFD